MSAGEERRAVAQDLGREQLDVEIAGERYTLWSQPDQETGDLYWNLLWPGALGLAEYLTEEWGGARIQGLPTLELGCGTGLVSLVASRLGADITASDVASEALRLVEEAAAMNRLDVQTSILDWARPPADRRWPLLLGADLIYYEPLFGPLIDCIERVLAPGGVALFSDPIRAPGTTFLQTLREHGFVFDQTLRAVTVGPRELRVGIYRIWRDHEGPPR